MFLFFVNFFFLKNIATNVFSFFFNKEFLGIKSQPLIEVSKYTKIKNILKERNVRVMTDYRIKTQFEINQLV